MDDFERAAIAAEGSDPDDPAVIAALERVTAVLAEIGRSGTPETCWLEPRTDDNLLTCRTTSVIKLARAIRSHRVG
jgi:hypothetical protein